MHSKHCYTYVFGYWNRLISLLTQWGLRKLDKCFIQAEYFISSIPVNSGYVSATNYLFTWDYLNDYGISVIILYVLTKSIFPVKKIICIVKRY